MKTVFSRHKRYRERKSNKLQKKEGARRFSASPSRRRTKSGKRVTLVLNWLSQTGMGDVVVVAEFTDETALRLEGVPEGWSCGDGLCSGVDRLTPDADVLLTCLDFLIHVEVRISTFRRTRWACDSPDCCGVARCYIPPANARSSPWHRLGYETSWRSDTHPATVH